MTKDELHDACTHAAATVVIAYALGCEFEDCRLTDDGSQWPTSLSRVEIQYPASWCGESAFSSIATIHEAGAMAVAKLHNRSPHRINRGGGASGFLNHPLIWRAVLALAEFIEGNDEGDGCFGALGTDGSEESEDSSAIAMFKDLGLTPDWRCVDGQVEPPLVIVS